MDHNLTLTISETIDALAGTVWEALTNKEQIKQYFFGTEAESDWKPGGPVTFTGTWEGQTYKDKGIILELEKGDLLKFSYWSSMSGLDDKPENYATVTYRLNHKNGKTEIKVTQRGFRDRQAYDHSAEGWKTVLKNLKSLVED